MSQPRYDPRAMRRRMISVITPVNLAGAVLVYIYYRWVDHHTLHYSRMPTAGEVIFSVVAFAALAYVGYRLNLRWSAPVRESMGAEGVLSDLARRRALQVPFGAARISAIGWLLATIIWGVVWPLIDGTFSVAHALRMMLGMLMAASLVVAAVFFLVERIWREALPALFPDGGLSEVKGVRHVSVRARLIVIFQETG